MSPARSLEQWFQWIQQCHPRTMELGLERVTRVARRLDLLPVSVPVITVAGTNGKGSTVALLETLARAQGLSTGVFTSPHLFHFCERMRLDGRPAPEAAVCEAFAEIERARGEDELTYYEFTALAALWLFRVQGPDMLILEVGLGGRLDAVNMVDADVAVITSVGLDHTDWLGETREAIAVEKAGILRPGRPLVLGATDMPPVVAALAETAGSPLLQAGDDFGAADGGIYWSGGRVDLPAHQVPLGADNLATAVQALALLERAPDENAIRAAADAQLAGRCEHRHLDGIDWYLDVGHNREALARFCDRLPPTTGRTLAVCAMLEGKPVEALAPFVPEVSHWYLAGLEGPRGAGPERLAGFLASACSLSCHDRVREATHHARQAARAGDRVLVFGSFHTVVEAVYTLEEEASWKNG